MYAASAQRYQLKQIAKQIKYKTMAVTAQWKNYSSLIQSKQINNNFSTENKIVLITAHL